ncbi:MAG: hypothetical protein HPY67_00235 [Syntrophaceae bacterium]|nr:hypothetical protein [Syntrophaceae bacterium]
MISIAGSGFGSVGPNVLLFDDFEKGRDGAQIATAPGAATVGNWDYTRLTVRYSTSFSHSGWTSLHSDWGSDGAAEGNRLAGKKLGAATELFFSWWQYIPIGAHVPGGGGPHGPNWKFFWLFGPRFPQSDYTCVLITDTLPPGYADYVGFGLKNDNTPPPRFSLGWIYPVEFRKGEWKRFDQYFKWGTSNNGHFGLWELKSTGYHQWADARNVTTGHEGEIWEHLNFPGYGRGDSNNAHTYYDDIYIAKGPGARARVEIGNKPTYSKCTNLAIITPTTWTDNRITATVRQGSFKAGDNAYLFVIDAKGAISPGYPVTIGGSRP